MVIWGGPSGLYLSPCLPTGTLGNVDEKRKATRVLTRHPIAKTDEWMRSPVFGVVSHA